MFEHWYDQINCREVVDIRTFVIKVIDDHITNILIKKTSLFFKTSLYANMI